MNKPTFKNNKLFIKPLIIFIVILTCITTFFAIVGSQKAFSNNEKECAEHVQGELVVCLETSSYKSANQANNSANEECAALRQQATSQIDEFLNTYDCQTLVCYAGDDETLNSVSNDNSFMTIKNPLLNVDGCTNDTPLFANIEIPVQKRFVTLYFDETQQSISSLISQLEKNPIVKYAEPNYTATTDAVGDLTQYQYSYDNEGKSGTAHNKAGMNFADWNLKDNIDSTKPVVAAVIDTGVDYLHPDIPFAGTDGGYDLQKIGYGGQYGYNAAANDITSEEAKDPDDVIVSQHGHGTHVAGSIAAKWDQYSEINNPGVSGGASKCYILPVRAANNSGMFTISTYIKATAYIIAQKNAGVNILVANNSWGGPSGSWITNENATLTGLSGIISLFAAGNANTNIDLTQYTASVLANNPYVITVDSTNEMGNKSGFTNYGVRTTDVCAPGTNILSTVPSRDIQIGAGLSDSLRTSDTRVLDKDAGDYAMIDDFEDTSGQTNLKYYNKELTEELPIVGTDQDAKGYESIHAVASDPQSSSFVLSGDLTPYVNTEEGAVNNITFLYNTDSGNKDIDNTVAVSVFDLNGRLDSALYSRALSTAGSGYMTVSVPVSKITNLKDVKLGVIVTYADENRQEQKVNVYLDNIAMAHVDMPYAFMSGTSMACPNCSGLAAVVANKFSGEPITKTVARIKGSTNHKTWLKDVCYSGGIVDQQKACSTNDNDFDPVVLNASMSTTNGAPVVVLSGYFLGDNSSKVTINGQSATKVEYSKKNNLEYLTCTFANPITGEAKITVDKNGKNLTRYYDLGDTSNLLESLPLPDKNDPAFYEYYNSLVAQVEAVSDDMICIESYNYNFVNSFYIYNIKQGKWSPTDMKEKITKAVPENTTWSYINSDQNTVYFNIQSGANTVGLVRYNIENDNMDIDLFNESCNLSKFEDIDVQNEGIANVNWMIIERDVVYIGSYNNETADVWKYDYTDKSLEKITTKMSCGTMPAVFKKDTNQYIFVDNGMYNITQTGFIADVYEVTLKDGKFTSNKLDIEAYPQQAKAFSQQQKAGYWYWDGKIITAGPAEFETVSNSGIAAIPAANSEFNNYQLGATKLDTYALVKADGFSIDINTGESTALPKIMSMYKATNPYSKGYKNTMYTAFIDNTGTLKVSKRVLDVKPSPTPPTPDPDNPEKYSSAATADTNSGLILFMICICAFTGWFAASYAKKKTFIY